MNGEFFFEIPDNREIMARLIEAVPSTWAWVDGALWAPKELVSSGQAIEDTGFELSRFHTIHPTIVGGYSETNRQRVKPNLFAIIVEQKLPGFIFFDEAGYQEHLVTMDLSKQVATAYVLKGFGGHLTFYKDCYDNSKYDNPAKCAMSFQPWHGPFALGKEAGEQPARARLQWEGRYRGKEEDIAPIVAVCRSLKLREYTPEPAAA